MNDGRTIFSQLISFLPDREFRRCVARYRGDSRLRGLSCWEQFLAMAFAQLTYRESLRDIEACLRALGAKRYHLGFRRMVARSTLADANEAHRLAHLRRLRTDTDRYRATALRERCHGRGTGSQPLRAGLDHHRSLLVAVSLGEVSQAEGCHQNAHAARSAWEYPSVYPCFRRQDARCQHARPDRTRGRSLLCHGPRLYRF